MENPGAASGFLGVIVTGSFLLFGRDGSGGPTYLNTGFVPAMINKNEPEWARECLWMLLNLLERGEQGLIEMP